MDLPKQKQTKKNIFFQNKFIWLYLEMVWLLALDYRQNLDHQLWSVIHGLYMPKLEHLLHSIGVNNLASCILVQGGWLGSFYQSTY